MTQSRIVIDDDLKRLLLDPEALPDKIILNGKTYTPERPVAAGYKAAVWRVVDDFGRPRAAKLAIPEDYDDRSYLTEMAYAARLERYSEFAKIEDAGPIVVDIAAKPYKFVCFLEEWVEGASLYAFLRDNPNEITVSFLMGYVTILTKALQALIQEDLRHDDLHERNVIITAATGVGVLAERKVKIIDNGSVKRRSGDTKKEKDDLESFVSHLVLIRNAIFRRKVTPAHERRFIKDVDRLLKSMLETDASIYLKDPSQIQQRFLEAHTRCAFPFSSSPDTLQSPFEFLSAEHIADDRVLVDIFAKSCPWLPKVAGRDPCLVTGPRGCGKSTIFRWLSLKAHLHLSDPDLDALQVSGFYISCSSDLQNRLGWIRVPAMAVKFEQAIIHFFNMLLAREIVYTLELVCQRTDRESRWGLGQAQEQSICEFVDKILGQEPTLRLQGLPRLGQLRGRLENEIFTTHMDWLAGKIRERCTPKTFLGDLTEFIVSILPYFKKKIITFLIDDFSVHRIPDPVQVILNRVIWERRSSHIFKLSAEKFGANLSDNFEATAELTRELTEVDCGKEFIALDDSERRQASLDFAMELLDNRLAKAGYAGKAEGIIGRSEWPDRSLAKALVVKREGGRNDRYHGLECISQLCSGDVATLLMVYRRIFELGNVSKSTHGMVGHTIQDQAIRDVSRKLLEATRSFFPAGPKLYAIAQAFGNLVRRILVDGRWQRVGTSSVPPQCPRIEIDQVAGFVVDDLNIDQKELAVELVRRSIFIEMDVGLSRHNSVTTLRWHFRRVFLPTFGAALAKNDAIKRKPDWLKQFLTDPQLACDSAWQTFPKRASAATETPQGDLLLDRDQEDSR